MVSTWHCVLCRSTTDSIVTAELKGAYGTTDEDFVVLTCACFVSQHTTRLRGGGEVGTRPRYRVCVGEGDYILTRSSR